MVKDEEFSTPVVYSGDSPGLTLSSKEGVQAETGHRESILLLSPSSK